MSSGQKYVRLADRLARGCQVDINSGWSIAGLDVVEYPDEGTLAETFVKTALSRGVLEYASRAEFDEVMEERNRNFHEEAGIDVERPKVEGYLQEGHLAGLHEESRRKLEASRGLGGGALSYKNDLARRQRLVDAAKELDDLGDDENPDEVEQPEPHSELSRENVGGDPEKGGAREELGEGTGDDEDGDDAPKSERKAPAKKSKAKAKKKAESKSS